MQQYIFTFIITIQLINMLILFVMTSTLNKIITSLESHHKRLEFLIWLHQMEIDHEYDSAFEKGKYA